MNLCLVINSFFSQLHRKGRDLLPEIVQPLWDVPLARQGFAACQGKSQPTPLSGPSTVMCECNPSARCRRTKPSPSWASDPWRDATTRRASAPVTIARVTPFRRPSTGSWSLRPICKRPDRPNRRAAPWRAKPKNRNQVCNHWNGDL